MVLDLDPRTSTIIVEFLLAQSISNPLASDLLRALPVSLDSRRIKIRVLLRRFDDFPVSSMETLSLLELLYKLSPSPSIPTAYSAIALHLAARHRDDAGFEDVAFQIWNKKVEFFKKSEELKGLVSKKLEEDGELVMRAVKSREERKKLYASGIGKEALAAIRVCFEEVTKSLGPSELEMAILASQKDGNPIGVSERTMMVVEDVGINDSQQEEANREGEGEERVVANDVRIGALKREGNPSRVLEEEERVRNDDVSSVGGGDEIDTSCDSPRHTVGERKKRNAVDVVRERVNTRSRTQSQSERIRRSETVDTRSESGQIRRWTKKEKKKKKYWSSEEEECLMKGIKEFGVGNWSAILSKYTILKENKRNSVNLKDKYRNMTKKPYRESIGN